MDVKLPKLIATSVVRGSQQGESHGGVYTVDFHTGEGAQQVDWNTDEIDWEGRGADRGLRGITFDDDDIYIAASDELFVYDRQFNIVRSHKNKYLKHCHEIHRVDSHIFLTSTGFDSLLSFNIETQQFDWGFHLQKPHGDWSGFAFDPRGNSGPRPVNDFHINTVFMDKHGIYMSGLRSEAVLHINNAMQVNAICSLPKGTHNARPWKDGVIFNDTNIDAVRYVAKDGTEKIFKVHTYDDSMIQNMGIDDSKIARQGFGRGLCTIDDRFIAGGSSPSTITIYDIETESKVGFVNLSMDVRNAIHGLELWPYDDD